MDRPKPDTRLIYRETGGNGFLLRDLHHGLVEVSLTAIYPCLNLDEVILFGTGSWELRGEAGFRNELTTRNLYSIFSEAQRRTSKWLSASRRTERNSQLNPFDSSDLERRLRQVLPQDIENLKKALAKERRTYLFGCDANREKRRDPKFVVMDFQGRYPKKGNIVPTAYATEISRLLTTYPTTYELPRSEPEQQELFKF